MSDRLRACTDRELLLKRPIQAATGLGAETGARGWVLSSEFLL